jgi:hypothetical protein
MSGQPATGGKGAGDKGAEGKPATGETKPQSGTDDEQLGEAGTKALESEREARNKAEREAKELRAQIKQLTEKDLPEAEKREREHAETKAERDALATELRMLRAQQAVFTAAQQLGFTDPMDAYRLIDVELDSDGKPTNVDKALKALLERKPYLASAAARAAGSADAGSGNGAATGTTNMNDNIRRMVRGGPPA